MTTQDQIGETETSTKDPEAELVVVTKRHDPTMLKIWILRPINEECVGARSRDEDQ